MRKIKEHKQQQQQQQQQQQPNVSLSAVASQVATELADCL